MHNATRAIRRLIEQHKRSLATMSRINFSDKEANTKQAYFDYRREIEGEIKELEEAIKILNEKTVDT